MTSYFVAGASRGIGLAITQKLATLHDNSIVYAGVRNTQALNANNPNDDRIRPIQLDITSQSSIDAAVAAVKSDIGSLDVLIIVAGVSIGSYAHLSTADDLHKSLDTNTVGAFRVIAGFLSLIRAGKVKKIIAIGTAGGSFGVGLPLAKMGIPLGVYGVSKAALQFLMMNLGTELAGEGIVTASVNPGIVGTDMARERSEVMAPELLQKFADMGMVAITPEESAEGIVKLIGELDGEKSGRLVEWDGGLKVLPF